MQKDDFGNLAEWGRVLNQLAQLTRDGTIDEHQAGLVRLLHYQDNWRLREAALEAIRHVRRPGEPLVTAVLELMTDEHLYHELRVLAAEALASLVAAGRAVGAGRNRELEQAVLTQMHALLDAPHPPVLHQAVRRILPTIE
jgi:hypothetical protein